MNEFLPWSESISWTVEASNRAVVLQLLGVRVVTLTLTSDLQDKIIPHNGHVGPAVHSKLQQNSPHLENYIRYTIIYIFMISLLFKCLWQSTKTYKMFYNNTKNIWYNIIMIHIIIIMIHIINYIKNHHHIIQNYWNSKRIPQIIHGIWGLFF